MAVTFTMEMTVGNAERYLEAIDTVLRECDVHADEAHPLEELRDRIDHAIECMIDYASDVEAY